MFGFSEYVRLLLYFLEKDLEEEGSFIGQNASTAPEQANPSILTLFSQKADAGGSLLEQ